LNAGEGSEDMRSKRIPKTGRKLRSCLCKRAGQGGEGGKNLVSRGTRKRKNVN